MSHRAALLVLASCAAAFAAGWAARGDQSAPAPAGPRPETIEVFRYPTAHRPAVAETLRVLTVTDGETTDELAAPRGTDRARWTVRVNRNGRVATYTAENVLRD